jgi:hypothetical protein
VDAPGIRSLERTVHTPTTPRLDLEEHRLSVRAMLAAAWTSFALLYAYVDIFSFYLPGNIDDIRRGVIWEFDISQTFVTGALTLVAIPILMVTLSTTLPARASRTLNLLVAPVYVLVSAVNVIDESWTVFFGLGIGLEVLLLALIVRLAWRWPRAGSPSPAFDDTRRLPADLRR